MRRRLPAVLLVAGALALPPAVLGSPKVGVTTLTFTKASATTGAPRPLATVIWYPAAPRTGTPEALGLRDATVRHGRFPLIVFSHGACGRPTEASYLAKALAAAGFVVAAPPHPGNTADDGAACASTANFADSVINRVPDVRFTIDSMLAEATTHGSPFARRLRPDAIGVAGLSFGGFTTLWVAQRDPRVRAALSMVPGGVEFLDANDITIPTMVIGAEHDHVVGYPESEHAYQRLAGPRFLVELLGGDHLNVVDDCSILCGSISQDAAHALVLHYALLFFRRYLADRHVPLRALVRPVTGVHLETDPSGSGN